MKQVNDTLLVENDCIVVQAEVEENSSWRAIKVMFMPLYVIATKTHNVELRILLAWITTLISITLLNVVFDPQQQKPGSLHDAC